MNKKLGLALVLILAAAMSVAQTAAAPQPPPTPSAPVAPQSATPAAQAERKITKEQADELLRSVDEILQFVSEDTGLPIKYPVKRQLADREQVRQFIELRLKDDPDTKRLEREEVVLKKFGLVPRDFSLRSFLLDLLQEQVAGFYDAKSQTVYLLDWVEPEQQKSVLAHELTHALQDQNFGLEKLLKAESKKDPEGLQSGERTAATQAVTEGQAMIVLMDYLLASMGTSVAKQPGMVELMQQQMNTSDPSMVVFNRAPLFLQQVLLFPYRYGTLFERDLLINGGKKRAFFDTLKDPPQETRQIMQPEAYLAGQRVEPLKPIRFERITGGYKRWDLSTMGQFEVLLLLRRYTDAQTAQSLSKQWRGGYYWAGLTPQAAKTNHNKDSDYATSDIAMAYVSRWSSAGAAQQFADAYSEGVNRRYPDASKADGEAARSGVVRWQTSDGQIVIEQRGDTVLVIESFESEAADKIREAALGK